MSYKKSFLKRFMKGMKASGMRGYRPRIICCKTTIQDSVPLHAVHEQHNLIESYPGMFTKSYCIGENNYQTETEEVEQNMFIKLRSIYNSLGNNCEMALTVFNRNINIEQFRETALIKESGDHLDYLRREMNKIITDRIKESRNGIEKKKYITLGVHCDDVKKANEVFTRRLDREYDSNFKKLQSYASPILMEDRLELLHDIYNMDQQGEFLTHTRVVDQNGQVSNVNSFDFKTMRRMGLTVKDLIAPSSIQYKDTYMRLGSKYVRVMRVDSLPSALTDDFLMKITDVNFNLMATINIIPIPSKEANSIVHKNLVLARNAKAEERKGLIKANLPEDMISPDVEEKVTRAEDLRKDMVEQDEKLFKTTFTVVFWADSLDQLQEYTETVTANAQSAVVGIRIMDKMQEEGFNTTLPLLVNELNMSMRRTLKSSSLTTLAMPFSIVELNDPGGINYSVNLISKALILFNRLLCQNQNGFILGTPGSGKSFAAKLEMLCVLLGSNSDCIVIDPEAEYLALCKLIGGEVIKIEPGGKWHINPMEIDVNYEWTNDDDTTESNPILAKADFILKLMNVIIKSPYNTGLSSIQETIVDECVNELYAPFVVNGRLQPIPPEKMPTLTDLQIALSKRKEAEARELAMGLKLYTGDSSLNTFGYQSNVDVHNRFIVYNIKDIGDKLKPIAMLIILDSILNRLFENRKRGRNTWFWVDEIYLLFEDEMTAGFLNMLFKRSRKYGGVPTGITQNVEDLLESNTARKMLSNSNFVQILNQAPSDREKLAELLNLSQSQVDVITSAGKGQGLIYTGSNCVPFASTFPKDNNIYRCLTSNMAEIKQYEEEGKRKSMQEKKAERKHEAIGA